MGRLDRALANDSWLTNFPNSQITHLSIITPFLLPSRIPKEDAMKDHSEWRTFGLSILILKMSYTIVGIIEPYLMPCLTFGVNQLNGIFLPLVNKIRLLARLRGIQNSNSYPTSLFLQDLETTLIKEYNDILKIEEDYWKLWSKKFHLSVINRRRKNHISFFKDDNDNWISSHEKIVDHALSYFKNCFTSEHLHTNWVDIKKTNNIFYKVDLEDLDRPLPDKKVVQALFSFKPFKALGPDGLHPHFFQHH